MRKWQDLAAPDDPGSWLAVGGMIPTVRGTYEAAPISVLFGGAGYTATGANGVIYAFSGQTLAGVREYVFDGTSIWEYNGASLTDRTGGVGAGTVYGLMGAQFGDATIVVRGVGNSTIVSTGGNFGALAGAPQGEIVCAQSNALLVFNTGASADGWAASDVGDYTNWTTGESSSGRIIATMGPVTAAVPYGNDVFVFKGSAIYRMTYVGGIVKWQIQLVWRGLGVDTKNTGLPGVGKFQAVATSRGVAFCAAEGIVESLARQKVFLFDGASPPVRLNPLTTIPGGNKSVYGYNAATDTLVISPWAGADATGSASQYFYYNFASDAWGAGNGSAGETAGSGSNGVLQGAWGGAMDIQANTRPRPPYWTKSATNTLARYIPTIQATPCSCFVQSSKYGRVDRKTAFSRLTPLMRRRTDLGSGTAVAHFSLFREREDVNAQTGRDVTESTVQKRFDLGVPNTDNFAAIRLTWTNLDVEIDDFLVASIDAGAN